jgi:hypothetical protein
MGIMSWKLSLRCSLPSSTEVGCYDADAAHIRQPTEAIKVIKEYAFLLRHISIVSAVPYIEYKSQAY